MTDLSLIPLEDLLKEVESRTVCFIAAFEFPKEAGKQSDYLYGKGSWHTAVRLASVLNNDVLNNWNGEMKYLQRISQSEEPEE